MTTRQDATDIEAKYHALVDKYGAAADKVVALRMENERLKKESEALRWRDLCACADPIIGTNNVCAVCAKLFDSRQWNELTTARARIAELEGKLGSAYNDVDDNAADKIDALKSQVAQLEEENRTHAFVHEQYTNARQDIKELEATVARNQRVLWDSYNNMGADNPNYYGIRRQIETALYEPRAYASRVERLVDAARNVVAHSKQPESDSFYSTLPPLDTALTEWERG